jgi:proteasome lid subunit RPN8/RPN11
MADYYAGRCEQASAQGRVPNLVDVARAFGLPDPDRADIAAFEDDVVSGRIASGTTVEQIRSRLLDGGGRRSADLPRTRGRSWYLHEASGRARGDPSGPSPALPQFLAASRAAFTIRLPSSVQTAIEQEVVGAIWRFDRRDVESGGWLFALYGADDDEVRIAYASGPGAGSKHLAGQLTLTRPQEIRAAFPDYLRRSQLVLVGDWHSHPAPDPEPSDADVKAWAKHSRLTASTLYASLIVTPGADMGWSAPDFHGFITYALDGRLVCEQSKVVATF